MAWDRPGTARVTVNTNSLDHPRALPLYQKAGFVPVRRETRTPGADPRPRPDRRLTAEGTTMLETLKPHAARQDHRADGPLRAPIRATDKLDLGVGVYKDAEGRTPVMRAVKAAEARLLARAGRPRPMSACSAISTSSRRWATSLFGDAVPRRAARRRADAGRHRGDPPALRADPPRQPRRDGLASPTRPGRTTRRSSPISASRRGPTATSTPRPAASTSRACWPISPGSRPATCAAARLLPQPDRRQPRRSTSGAS